MKDFVLVKVSQAFQQLEHVAFDLRLGEFDIWIVEQPREIMVHVRRDHVQYRSLSSLGLGSFDGHFFQLKYVVVREHLEQFDLA